MIARSFLVTTAFNLLIVGCSSTPSTTPSEDLARASHETRAQLADLKARDVVVTPEKVEQLLGPIDTATERFIEEIEEWGNNSFEPEYITAQMAHVRAATTDLNAILAQFGVVLDPDAPTTFPADENSQYWKRYLCYAAVAGGTGGCVAACTALGFAAPVCAATCAVAGKGGLDECAKIQCWAGAGSGSGCDCGSGSGSGSCSN